MDQQELDFIKGFNNGYLLAKHEPELMNKLIKTPGNDNEYLKGLHSGKNEHDIEKAREQLKNEPNKETPVNKSKDIDKER